MAKKNRSILILEDDAYFRGILEGIASSYGDTIVVGDVSSALIHLRKQSFQMLLLDWHLNPDDLSTVHSAVENFQPNAQRIALFTVPDLAHVIEAMKSGVKDVLWASLDQKIINDKIKDAISKTKPPVFAHSFVSRLAVSFTEKAMDQQTSLFQARREFSKTFLQQILSQQKLRRTQLASLMSVSPRTLHRHLSA